MEPQIVNIGDARYALHFGPYVTPRFRIGQIVKDEVRGEVRIVGITDGRIPWPIGQTKRARSLVIFRGIAKAIRSESNTAICYWWGVTGQTVTKWRKGLGVTGRTLGHSKLQSAYSSHPDFAEAVLTKMWETAQDPERAAKISASKMGVPRPQYVIEKMRKANLGKKASKATRAKMSAARRRRRRTTDNAVSDED